MSDKLNILIGTPAYGGMVHIDYLNSVLEYRASKLPITVMNLGNESLITRARNTVFSYFYANPQFSHLLFLDADIHLDARGLVTLLKHQKNLCGAAVALKGFNAEGEKVYNIGKLDFVDSTSPLAKTDRLGTAVWLMDRTCADILALEAEEQGFTYGANPSPRGASQSGILQYDIFRVGVVDGEYLSEDYYVVNKLKALGIDTYVDTSIKTRHNGMFTF